MKDSKRRWHTVHTTDADARPMLGPFSGMAIIVLLGSILIAMGVLHTLNASLGLGFLSSATTAGALPVLTCILLLNLKNKPAGYALRWFQHQHLKLTQQPLLTEPNDNETQTYL